MKKTHLIVSLMCVLLSISNSYSQTAKEVVKSMGPGFNLGNVFDNGVKETTFNSFKPVIDMYLAEGMTHIRIPVTWYDYVDGTRLTDANGNINVNSARFKDVVTTVDYALSKGLYVVLNTHHEHWLKDNYNGSAYYNTIFTTLWTSIANYFKAYPSKLAFEVLNEPEGVMGQWGEPVPPTAQSGILYTRQINKVGYDAIRATGGNNTTRIVMISPNGQANDSQIEEVYPNVASLPGGGNDQYLAMHVHSYDPWEFCGQTGSNANYPGAQQVRNDITVCYNHAKNNLGGIAIHYGEFGVGRDPAQGGGPQSERGAAVVTEYYQTFAQTCFGLGIAFSVWDDRGWFSLSNDAGTAFTYDLVPKMLSVLDLTPKTITDIPGRLQAESFNEQSGLQNEQLAVAEGTDLYLGYTTPNDFAKYTIKVARTANYTTSFRVASAEADGGSFSLYLDGVALIPLVQVNNTAGWQNWVTVSSTNVNLSVGEHTLELRVVNGGFNLNWMDINVVPEAPVLAFTNLTNNQNINFGTDLNPNVSATHSSGIANVVLYVDNVLLRQESQAPYDWGLGTNDPSLNTLAEGKHTLKAIATAVSGEVAETSISITIVKIVTGLEEEGSSIFRVYPNPATDVVHLSIETDWALANVSGLEIMSGYGNKINTSELPKGIFFLKAKGSVYKVLIE